MMRLPRMDHYAPTSLEEALSLLDKHGQEAKVLAGGTDILVACKMRNIEPAMLVSLSRIQELKGINTQGGQGLRIGAMTSLNEVRYNSSISKNYPALMQATASVGTTQLRHMGTVGGNLCLNTRCIYYNQSNHWRKSRRVCLKMGGDTCHVVPKGKKCYAVYSGDAAPALIALNAQVKLVSSKGERIIPLAKMYTGDGKEPLAIKSGELLSEVRIPTPSPRQSSIYLKYRMRGAIDFPLVGAAVRMDSDGDGACAACKVVLNAVGSAPVEVQGVGELLKGQSIKSELVDHVSKEAVKSAHPVANSAGSTPTYRRQMAGILTRRSLIAAAGDLGLI